MPRRIKELIHRVRCLLYPLWVWWYRILNWPIWLSLHIPRPDRYHGIALVDCGHRTVSNKALFEMYTALVRDALDLLSACDARRFHLVQRELHYIVNQYTPGGGAHYSLVYRRCVIHFEGFLAEPPDPGTPAHRWWVAMVAAILVHEATHGRIARHRIRYDSHPHGNWQRIEQICRQQERLFAERIPDTTYDYVKHLVPPLDVAWYRAHFSKSRWERLRDLTRYLREQKS